MNWRRCFQWSAMTICALLTFTSTAEPQRGGTLTIGMEAQFPVFDPLTMGALVERSAAAAFYETLFELNEQGELVPLLAESYDVSDDGKIYTIRLRTGIEFHDGTPFNADAVVYNFERLRAPENGCRCIAEIEFVNSVTALDEHTVQFTLDAPNAGFIAILSDVSGMQPSPTAIEKHGDQFAENPVGTGPFRFVQWDRGVALTVERNPNYWREGLPYLDRVVYRPIPDNQTRMASLLAGDIDVSTVPAAEDVAAVKAGKHDLQLIEAPALGTVFTMFNTKHPALGDNRVRQALFHAIDRETINQALNRGIFPLANNPYGNGLFGGELDNEFPPYNPDKARELLAEYGKPVKFELSLTPVPTTVRMGQVLQQMWKQLGIDVTLQQYEQRQLVARAIDRRFDAMLFRWSGRADPDLNTHQFFYSDSPRNYTSYSSEEMDALLDRGRTTLDREQRADIYRQIGELLAAEGPYHFLWSQSYYFIARPAVQNLKPIPGGIPRVRDVWLTD